MKEPQSVSWARTRKVRKDVTLTQAVKALRHHEVRNHLFFGSTLHEASGQLFPIENHRCGQLPCAVFLWMMVSKRPKDFTENWHLLKGVCVYFPLLLSTFQRQAS